MAAMTKPSDQERLDHAGLAQEGLEEDCREENHFENEGGLWAMLTEKNRRLRWRVALFGAEIGGGLTLFDQILNPQFAPGPEWDLVAIAAVGGAVGGWCAAGWIGRRGIVGVILTLLGVLLAGMVGGAVGGTLVIPVLGTIVGAGLGLWLPLSHLYLFGAWTVLCAALHMFALRARKSATLRET
jgi:hypothetical protein